MAQKRSRAGSKKTTAKPKPLSRAELEKQVAFLKSAHELTRVGVAGAVLSSIADFDADNRVAASEWRKKLDALLAGAQI